MQKHDGPAHGHGAASPVRGGKVRAGAPLSPRAGFSDLLDSCVMLLLMAKTPMPADQGRRQLNVRSPEGPLRPGGSRPALGFPTTPRRSGKSSRGLHVVPAAGLVNCSGGTSPPRA